MCKHDSEHPAFVSPCETSSSWCPPVVFSRVDRQMSGPGGKWDDVGSYRSGPSSMNSDQALTTIYGIRQMLRWWPRTFCESTDNIIQWIWNTTESQLQTIKLQLAMQILNKHDYNKQYWHWLYYQINVEAPFFLNMDPQLWSAHHKSSKHRPVNVSWFIFRYWTRVCYPTAWPTKISTCVCDYVSGV